MIDKLIFIDVKKDFLAYLNIGEAASRLWPPAPAARNRSFARKHAIDVPIIQRGSTLAMLYPAEPGG